MSFNINYFSKIAHPGGSGGNSIWSYFDYAADNVASLATGTVNSQFFKTAYTLYGIAAAAGDLILVASRNATNGSNNTATPVMFQVPTAWDSNGASVAGYVFYKA